MDTAIAQHLRSITIHSLDSLNYRNAEFAAERLLAHTQSPDSLYLYALTLYHQGKYKSAFNKTAEHPSHVGCAYIYARLCLVLGKHKEGIFRLVNVVPQVEGAGTGQHSRVKHDYESRRSIYPDALAIHHLLGDLHKASGDTKSAALHYATTLRHNAFDFEAFQEVARLGAEVRVKSIYNTDEKQMANPFAVTTTPKPKHVEVSTPRVAAPVVPDAPVRRTHGEDGKRLFSRSLKRTSEPVRAGADVEAADQQLRRLYGIFAKAFRSFCRYDCYKAIRTLEALPENERDTPWVLLKLGRLHYEIVNYKQSRRFFMRLRQLDRTRLEDMEYYSTLLWHLHRKVELTHLANELHDIDPSLAITWCVMGNLFSLVREPDEAIRCFDRSLALDSTFTYAHTLKGHEYFSTDNYERALDCFRLSLLIDPRHYNAFYGIGMVYINLGEYQRADYHFRKAVAINPINIILICCVGMVLEKLGKKTLALRQYELANKLQPLSALPVFKKAQLLFSMQQFPQALKQFELVKDLAPNEASVHFLLGQLYNIQNDKFAAIREFTVALNLDPKGNYLIREAMEMLKDS